MQLSTINRSGRRIARLFQAQAKGTPKSKDLSALVAFSRAPEFRPIFYRSSVPRCKSIVISTKPAADGGYLARLTCANEEKPNRIWSCGALAIGIAFPIIPAILSSRSRSLAVASCNDGGGLVQLYRTVVGEPKQRGRRLTAEVSVSLGLSISLYLLLCLAICAVSGVRTREIAMGARQIDVRIYP